MLSGVFCTQRSISISVGENPVLNNVKERSLRVTFRDFENTLASAHRNFSAWLALRTMRATILRKCLRGSNAGLMRTFKEYPCRK